MSISWTQRWIWSLTLLMSGTLFEVFLAELSKLLDKEDREIKTTGWFDLEGNKGLHQSLSQLSVKALQVGPDAALLVPDDHLLGELGHDQERPPGALLLRLDDVAEDVVAHVQHVLAARADQLREDLAVAA